MTFRGLNSALALGTVHNLDARYADSRECEQRDAYSTAAHNFELKASVYKMSQSRFIARKIFTIDKATSSAIPSGAA